MGVGLENERGMKGVGDGDGHEEGIKEEGDEDMY